MMLFCESCERGIEIPKHATEVTCSCGARYEIDHDKPDYKRIVTEITSFYPPGEPTRNTCIAELLKALKKRREADREIEFWERKLREATHG